MRANRLILGCAATACLLAACDDPPTGPRSLSHVEIVSGAGQTGVAGQALPEPIVARAVLDDGESPFGGVLIARIVSGNGSLATNGGSASGNGSGIGTVGPTLSVTWALGAAAEPQEIQFSATAPAFGPDTVTATVTATVSASPTAAIASGR